MCQPRSARAFLINAELGCKPGYGKRLDYIWFTYILCRISAPEAQ